MARRPCTGGPWRAHPCPFVADPCRRWCCWRKTVAPGRMGSSPVTASGFIRASAVHCVCVSKTVWLGVLFAQASLSKIHPLK